MTIAQRFALVAAAGLILSLTPIDARSAGPASEPPAPPREFRGAWVATVANIDWPTAPGLPAEQQRAELLAMFDTLEATGFNAVVLQVRPTCDALYASDLEPWSEYLTGEMGKAPEPAYDPLAFAVEEAHARGLQVHAWLNPYRARRKTTADDASPDHVSVAMPDSVVEYGKHLWLDPGDEEAAAHSLAVVADLMERYDLDGLHFDDYFYPYPIREDDVEVDFPDDRSWNAYLEKSREAGDEPLSRADWRRDNVNRFIQAVGKEVRNAKPHAVFGVSPFGIWRPGHPETIQGFDAYDKLYADSRKWFREGWVDYLAPQLYWKIDSEGQSFPELLSWWAEQNPKGRGLWPGLYASRVGPQGVSQWEAEEIVDQIEIIREQAGANGAIHFSAKAIVGDWGGLATALRDGVYAEAALPPASPRANQTNEPKPQAQAWADPVGDGQLRVRFSAEPADAATYWVVQAPGSDGWRTEIVSGAESETTVAADNAKRVAVSCVDRFGRLTPARVTPASGSDD